MYEAISKDSGNRHLSEIHIHYENRRRHAHNWLLDITWKHNQKPKVGKLKTDKQPNDNSVIEV